MTKKSKGKHYKGYQKHLDTVVQRCDRECDELVYKYLDADEGSKKREFLFHSIHKCRRECQGSRIGRKWRKTANQALYMPEWSQR